MSERINVQSKDVWFALGIMNSSKTPRCMPLRSNYEEIMVTGAGFSVVVTVTVTVTVAWPLPAPTFSFTCGPIGAVVMPALSALVVDVLVILASVGWRLSGLPVGDWEEDCTTGVEISG